MNPNLSYMPSDADGFIRGYKCPIGGLSETWIAAVEEASNGIVSATQLTEGLCDYDLFNDSLEFLTGSTYNALDKELDEHFSDASEFNERYPITHISYYDDCIVFVSIPDSKPEKTSASDIVLSALGVL